MSSDLPLPWLWRLVKKTPALRTSAVEIFERVPIEDVGAVQHVGGAGDHESGDGSLRPDGTAAVEPHEHGLALHDPDHGGSDIVQGFRAEHLLGQDADFLSLVGDVEGLVNHAALVLGEVEVQRVVLHRQGALLPGLEAYTAAFLRILRGGADDKNPIGSAHCSGVCYPDERVGAGDPPDLPEARLVHGPLEDRAGLLRGADSSTSHRMSTPFLSSSIAPPFGLRWKPLRNEIFRPPVNRSPPVPPRAHGGIESRSRGQEGSWKTSLLQCSTGRSSCG